MPTVLFKKLFALALAVVSVTATCSNYNTYKGPLTWQTCKQKGFQSLECATFDVPLDWSDCSSEPISLTVARIPSNSSSETRSLFIRFGGPGLYTSSYLLYRQQWRDFIPHFNVLVLDNRGTGLNYPVKCDYDLWNTDNFHLYPKTEEEYNTTVENHAKAGQSCVNLTGPIINHLDALTHAKDLEALRVALDEPLTIYALSWGSQALSQYADVFPNNIRAMVLDGNEPHFLSAPQYGLSETMNMAFATQRVLGWASTNKTSPLYGQDTVQFFRDLVKKVEEKPLHKPECDNPKAACRAKVTAQDILSRTESWSEIPSAELFLSVAECLSELHKGNATCIPTDNWTNKLVEQNTVGGLPWTQAAIGCQDWIVDTTWEAYRDWSLITDTQAIPADKGYHNLIQVTCPRWPTGVTNPQPIHAPNVNTSAPILIVNALWDPATGYDQAVEMHRHFTNSVLLTRNGEGHGSLHFPETFAAMRDYLIDLKLPEPNTILGKPIGTFDILIKEHN